MKNQYKRAGGWKNFGRRGTGGLRGLENWTIFMDAIFVSSLIIKINAELFSFQLNLQTHRRGESIVISFVMKAP